MTWKARRARATEEVSVETWVYIALAVLVAATVGVVVYRYVRGRAAALEGARRPGRVVHGEGRFSEFPVAVGQDGETVNVTIDSHPLGGGYADPSYGGGKTSMFEDSSTGPIRAVDSD
jgi:hypothetical protein